MSYPHLTQFDEIALRELMRKQLTLELDASRGRSMWRERPPRPSRFRFRLRAVRA